MFLMEEFDDYQVLKPKEVVVNISRFTVDGSESEEYGDYTKKTAEMLGDSYMKVHGIFTREKWPLIKIKQRYDECSKMEIAWRRIMWYSKRKKDNEARKKM